MRPDKEDFKNHLDESVKRLVNFTKQYCYNDITDNYLYIIEPSGEKYHNDMTDLGKRNLDTILKFKNKTLTQEQAVDLLYVDEMIPNWINISVYHSSKKSTTIHLFATREWRLYSKAVEDYPRHEIFHAQVTIPFDTLKRDADGKYDINWKKNFDERKSGNLLFRLRKLLRMN